MTGVDPTTAITGAGPANRMAVTSARYMPTYPVAAWKSATRQSTPRNPPPKTRITIDTRPYTPKRRPVTSTGDVAPNRSMSA